MNNRFLSSLTDKQTLNLFAKFFLVSMLILATVCLVLFKLASFDLWLHLKTGQLVLNQGFPKTDPFSYTIKNSGWIAHEWLFGLIFYSLYQVVGSVGLVLIKVKLVLAIIAGVYFSNEQSRRNFWISMPLLFVAILASRFRLLLRPHLFSFLFLALYYLAYRRWREGQRKWLLLFPLIMVFWSNIHAGSVFGLVFLALVFLGELILSFISWGPEQALERGKLVQWLLISLLTGAAALINPYGYHTLLLPFTLRSMQDIPLLKLVEWLPFPLSGHYLLYGYFALVSLWLFVRVKKLSPVAILLYGFYAVLLLSARRGVPYWAFLTIPFIEDSFQGLSVRKIADSPWRIFFVTQVVGLAMVIISLVIVIRPHPIYRFGWGVRYDKIPRKAADFVIRENIRGRMFNSYKLGGYLIWRLSPERKVFLDGRASLYQDLFRRRSAYNVEQMIDYYGADYLIVDYQEKMPFSLEYEPEPKKWALVFWDDAARVYLKRIPRFRRLIDRYEYRVVKPTDNGLSFLWRHKDNLREIELEIRRATEGSEYNLRARIFSAGLSFVKKDTAAAETLFNSILKRKPDPTILFSMATLLHRLKL